MISENYILTSIGAHIIPHFCFQLRLALLSSKLKQLVKVWLQLDTTGG